MNEFSILDSQRCSWISHYISEERVPMIKAIIFDFDGTIIDTETAWYMAFRDLYQEYGVDLTLEMYSQCIGTSLHNFNPYEYLVTELKWPIDLDEFRKSVQERHTEIMAQEQIRPGIIEYLQQAKQSGLKIGLASSSERAWVDKHIDQLGLSHYFEFIRTSDNVRHVKPDPELYLQTLSGLGVQSSDTIAVEDSPNGARAAMKAGIFTVVVPNSITKLLPFDDVHMMKQSLLDIPFESLVVDAAVERRMA